MSIEEEIIIISRDEVLGRCEVDGSFFTNYLARPYKDDKEIALAACSKDGSVLSYASERLLNDKDVVLTACRCHGDALKYASDQLQNDKDVVMEACKNDGRALQFASKRLQGDKDVVFLACQSSSRKKQEEAGWMFFYASDKLKSDREFVLKVCKEAGGWRALEYCLLEFTADKEIVLAACQASGDAFQFADTNLREKDRSFVLQVCKVDGKALKFAGGGGEQFRMDYEIVLAAVQSNGMALEYASEELRSSKDIVLAAAKSTPEALKFALGGLNQNKDCLIAANIWDENYDDKKNNNDNINQDDSPSTIRNTKRKLIVLSTKFSLSAESSAHATKFAVELKRHPYIANGNFVVYSPNAFSKGTCDPNWTDMNWPCRGTYGTCKKPPELKPRMRNHDDGGGGDSGGSGGGDSGDGKPNDACCWRFSFRYHLEEARDSKGFMIQVADYKKNYLEAMYEAVVIFDGPFGSKFENHELGNGQQIETEMANGVNVKVFRFFEPESHENYDTQLNQLISYIQKWYDSDCKDMSEWDCREDGGIDYQIPSNLIRQTSFASEMDGSETIFYLNDENSDKEEDNNDGGERTFSKLFCCCKKRPETNNQQHS